MSDHPLLSIVTICGAHAADAEALFAGVAEALRDDRLEFVLYDTLALDETALMFARWRAENPAARMRLARAAHPDTYYRTLSREACARGNRFLGERLLDGSRAYFDFSLARNAAATHASSDYVVVANTSDLLEAFDADRVLASTSPGCVLDVRHHLGPVGDEVDVHVANRVYDRRAWRWTGRTHEHLERRPHPLVPASVATVSLPSTALKMRHRRNQGKVRNYALGLWAEVEATGGAVGRWYNYLGNEAHGMGYPVAATRAWEHGAALPGGWNAEACDSLCRSSLVSSGDMDRPEEARALLMRALDADASRREPWILLAELARAERRHHLAKGYAAAALAQRAPEFASLHENWRNYADRPHEIMQWAHSWIPGEKSEARASQRECERLNPGYWYYGTLRNHGKTTLALVARDAAERAAYESLARTLREHVGDAVACEVASDPADVDPDSDVVVCAPSVGRGSLPRACRRVARFALGERTDESDERDLCWLPLAAYAAHRGRRAFFPLAALGGAPSTGERSGHVLKYERTADEATFEAALDAARHGASVLFEDDAFDRERDEHLLPFALGRRERRARPDRSDWFAPAALAALFVREVLRRA